MRAITLRKALTLGSRSWPAGLTVTLAEKDADEAIDRGAATESTGATAGTATIKSGTNSIVVPHQLGRAPADVNVTGTHAEVQSCIVVAASSSSITIQTGGGANTTADRSVYWSVR